MTAGETRRHLRPSRADLVAREGKEVLICGAGDAGVTMLREMQRNRALGYNPVGIIDDTEAGLVVTGVPDGVRIIVAGQDLVRDGDIPAESNVLYAHLGGQPAVHAYAALFTNTQRGR